MDLTDYNGFISEERDCNEYVERHEEANPEIIERYIEEVKVKPRKQVYIKNLWIEEDDNPLD